ncbi:hypothetical protein BDV96DRAFT_605811 [Lophiotrema nucula]|uniref:Uncharacterized protein n=1 Tax=Lophiotrema nucula TaxID=690887 RepID=A0A6A5YM12_9PLEO|nr:hypothetical protein BDV96DRAFT_605811 [Lophiotrema nucula]
MSWNGRLKAREQSRQSLNSWVAPPAPNLPLYSGGDDVAQECHKNLTKLADEHVQVAKHINTLELRRLDIEEKLDPINRLLPVTPAKFAHICRPQAAELQEPHDQLQQQIFSEQKKLRRFERYNTLILEDKLKASCQALCVGLTTKLPRELRDCVYELLVGNQHVTISQVARPGFLRDHVWNHAFVGRPFVKELTES